MQSLAEKAPPLNQAGSRSSLCSIASSTMSIDGPTACPSLVPSREEEPDSKKAMDEDEEKATGRSESVEEVVWVHWSGDE